MPHFDLSITKDTDTGFLLENSAKFGVSFLRARLHGSRLSKTGKSKIKKAVKHL